MAAASMHPAPCRWRGNGDERAGPGGPAADRAERPGPPPPAERPAPIAGQGQGGDRNDDRRGHYDPHQSHHHQQQHHGVDRWGRRDEHAPVADNRWADGSQKRGPERHHERDGDWDDDGGGPAGGGSGGGGGGAAAPRRGEAPRAGAAPPRLTAADIERERQAFRAQNMAQVRSASGRI